MGEPSDSRELLPVLRQMPGHLFWRAAARTTAALGDALPPSVDIHAHAALLALADGVARSQQTIAEMISVSRTTMTRVAGDLVDQNLVQRVRNPDDRRSYALTRTPAGTAIARRWQRHVQHAQDALMTSFAADEVEELGQLLLIVARPSLSIETPEPLLESIPFLITRIHAVLHATMLTTLEPVGIEPRHLGTLTGLRATGPISQAELARMLGVSHPAVVQIVDDLEVRDLLERRRLPTDRRTQILHLTAAAEPVLDQARDLADAAGDHLLVELSSSQRADLLDLLSRYITAP